MTTSFTPPIPHPIPSRRGFALPVVIVVLMIVGMVSAVLLQRTASDRLVAQRRLTWYKEHHAQAGLEEVIDAWLRSLPRNLRLDEMLDERGYALTIDMRDGTEAVLFIRDGQGAILTEPAAVAEAQRPQVEAITQRFNELVGVSQKPLERRGVGPVKLSLQSASEEAIEATVGAIAGAIVAVDFAQVIIDFREGDPDGRITNDTLTMALTASAIESDEQAQRLRAAFTLRPTLYFVTIEMRPKGAMQRRERDSSVFFGGYIPIAAGRSATGPSSFDQRSGFLSFERLPIQ